MNEVMRSGTKPEFDIQEMMKAVWSSKWIIIFVVFIFSALGVVYALSLPNIYKSEVTLAPAEDDGLKVPGQLGGLAALAGVNLAGKGGDKIGIALEILKSRDFIGRFIEKNNLYAEIMAAEGWDRESNTLIINPKIYDKNSEKWVRKVQPPFQQKPSNLEAYYEFRKSYSVNQDKITGMIRLSVEHYSPFIAQRWAEKLVDDINEDMRSRDLKEANNSISYLNKQIEETNIADVRAMLFSLIEEQTKTVMLANVRAEYVFKTIDYAVVAEEKAKPSRALVVILMTMLGGMLAVTVVLIRYYKRKN